MSDSARYEHRPPRPLVAWSRLAESLARRLRDPRMINPIWVFAGGLSVVVPVWLLFFNR
jgi:hypothetical protein